VLSSRTVNERGENAWNAWWNRNSGSKLGNGASPAQPYQPARANQQSTQTPGIQFWGAVAGFGVGAKPGNGFVPKIEATNFAYAVGGNLGNKAAPTPQPGISPAIQPAPPIPAAPAYSAAPAPNPLAPADPSAGGNLDSQGAKASSLSATTNSEPIFCRRWPDTISSDGLGVRVFTGNTNIDVTCWTMASMEGSYGRVNQDSLWLKTSLGCYVNEADTSVRTRKNYQQQLNQCPTTSHWVGTLQSQYKREDCYICPSLDCPSQNLGIGPFIDLECHSEGDPINGNTLAITVILNRK